MTRAYPDAVAGPYDPPPCTFDDAEGRPIEIQAYDGDYESLVDMYLEFDSEDRAQGIPPVDETQIRDWLDTILADDCHNVVAWHDGNAVGHATLVPDHGGDESPAQPAYELAIFVLDTHQEAGIGTRLIKTLLGLGRQREVERVWLTVERWNRAAVGLYEKVGFESTENGSFELEMAARLR